MTDRDVYCILVGYKRSGENWCKYYGPKIATQARVINPPDFILTAHVLRMYLEGNRQSKRDLATNNTRKRITPKKVIELLHRISLNKQVSLLENGENIWCCKLQQTQWLKTFTAKLPRARKNLIDWFKNLHNYDLNKSCCCISPACGKKIPL